MDVVDIYPKRQKRLRGEVPDVYSYDALPKALRVQIVHIWRDALGDAADYANDDLDVRGTDNGIVGQCPR